ncbi:MAG: hypothetical protein JNG88_17495 [Phycisphaerales bacterium]|nr:hypothetical protein [Phycisphaerales bacterium]
MAAPRDGELRLTTPAGYRLYRMPATFARRLDPFVGMKVNAEWTRYGSVLIQIHESELRGESLTSPRMRPSIVTSGWSVHAIGGPEAGVPWLLEWLYFPPGLVSGAVVSGATVGLLSLAALFSRRKRVSANSTAG